MFTWRSRRQLIVLALVAGALVLAGIFALYQFLPGPSCTDRERNQGETEMDCGGPCAPCELRNPQSVSIFWTKALPIRHNVYTVIALVRNPNEALGAPAVQYEFSLFDGLGQIARREGTTFLLPQERAHIVEAGVTAARTPTRVEFKITGIRWAYQAEPFLPNLPVESRAHEIQHDESGQARSVITAEFSNRSVYGFREAEIGFIVFDAEENLLGANRITADNITAGAKRELKSIWPVSLGDTVSSIHVEPRVNVYDASVFIRP